MGWLRHHLQDLLRPRDLRRARTRGCRGAPASDGARRPTAPGRCGGARASGYPLRIPRLGPVESGGGSPVQSRQAAARPVCARDRRRGAVAREPARSRVTQVRMARCTPIRRTRRRTCRAVSSWPTTFDWQGDRHPQVPWSESVIYECHVKGMTALHPGVPAPAARYLARARLRTGHRAPQEPGRDGGRAAAGAACRRQRAARAQRAHQLLGLRDDRVLRARPPVRERRRARASRVPGDGAPAARRRHRGAPRRGVQPHR